MKKHDILVPLFSTFDKDGGVDYETFEKLADYVLSKGADGLYVGGSSAECFSLTQEERKEYLEHAIKVAKKYDAYVVAHVGAIGLSLIHILRRGFAAVAFGQGLPSACRSAGALRVLSRTGRVLGTGPVPRMRRLGPGFGYFFMNSAD